MITLTSYFCLLAFCFPDYSQNIHKMHVKNTKVSLDHIPDTENSWVLSHDRMKNEELENIANAIKIFEHLWNKKFGINTKVEKNLQNIFIEIGRKYIYHRVYSERNKKVELTRVKGLTTSKNTIWVKLQKNEKVCESSIFHELNHLDTNYVL